MDPQRRTLIVTGIVLLLILAIIFGTAFFLIRALTQRGKTTTPSASPKTIFPVQTVSPTAPFPVQSVSPTSSPAANTPSASPRGTTTVQPSPTPNITTQGNLKVYKGAGFTLKYPSNWGILTCSNSANFELDPTNPTDQINVSCNFAVKPITVLVGQNSCGGGVVELGGVKYKKGVNSNLVTSTGRGIGYEWCTVNSPALDITHRVGNGTAFSSQDYSFQVEQMLSALTAGGGS